MAFRIFILRLIARCLLIFVILVLSLPKCLNGVLVDYTLVNGAFPQWGGKCNKGMRQSPIDIVESNALTYNKYDALQILNLFGIINNVSLNNDGNGLTIDNLTEDITVVGGPLLGDFSVDHIDFHAYSEHTFNDMQFPLECQIVCRNKRYPNFNEAIGKVNGVAIISVLYHMSQTKNKGLNKIVNNVAKVQSAEKINKPTILTQFWIGELLPRIGPYFTYFGSLTRPNCTEGVTWIILRDTYPIDSQQLNEFKSIESATGKKLENNFRPIQATKDRTVIVAFESLQLSSAQAGTFDVSIIIYVISLQFMQF